LALAEAESARPRNALKPRVLSALVLAPVAIAAAWFGWPWLPILTLAASAVMAWEWARLCCSLPGGKSGVAVTAIVITAVNAYMAFGLRAGAAVALAGAGLVYILTRCWRQKEPGWLALGVVWIVLPCVLLLWLARPEVGGRITVLWIFAVVWATDIGAYAAGRTLGGPRLAPRWSPNKTWAGLSGGIACAALAGWGTAALLGVSPLWPIVLISAGLAVVEQFGDLAESMAKRRFGVKDSGGLIPGHGGLLDRLDGLLAVVPAVALLSLVDSGALRWQ
jgi:phosphatidate cytidylyltransferase